MKKCVGPLLFVGSFAISLLVADLLVPPLYARIWDRPFPSASEYGTQDPLTISEGDTFSPDVLNTPTSFARHRLHPYFGFSYIPDKQSPYSDLPVNQFGFLGLSPLVDKTEDIFQVAILGGSLAMFLTSGQEMERFRRALAQLPGLSSKKIHLISLAIDGAKQPQQLLILNYLSSLGVSFDLVVNIDGFNEVVLPLSENRRFAVSPSFPRKWNFYMQRTLSPDLLDMQIQIGVLKTQQQRLAEISKESILKYSNLVAVFLSHKINQLELQVMKLNQEALDLSASLSQVPKPGPSRTGHAIQKKELVQWLNENVRIWSVSSKKIHDFCITSDCTYVHFLQPNLHYNPQAPAPVPETYSKYVEYSSAAAWGYPFLVASGEELKEYGINFFDLTDIATEQSDKIYRDQCCHLNEVGERLLMERIIAALHRITVS